VITARECPLRQPAAGAVDDASAPATSGLVRRYATASVWRPIRGSPLPGPRMKFLSGWVRPVGARARRLPTDPRQPAPAPSRLDPLQAPRSYSSCSYRPPPPSTPSRGGRGSQARGRYRPGGVPVSPDASHRVRLGSGISGGRCGILVGRLSPTSPSMRIDPRLKLGLRRVLRRQASARVCANQDPPAPARSRRTAGRVTRARRATNRYHSLTNELMLVRPAVPRSREHRAYLLRPLL